MKKMKKLRAFISFCLCWFGGFCIGESQKSYGTGNSVITMIFTLGSIFFIVIGTVFWAWAYEVLKID